MVWVKWCHSHTSVFPWRLLHFLLYLHYFDCCVMRLWVLLNLLENTELFCLSKQLVWLCWSCESWPAFCGLCFQYHFSLQSPQCCSGWLLCISRGQSRTWRVVHTVNSQSICCAHSGQFYTYWVWELTSGGSDGKNLPFLHCWWGCQLTEPLQRRVWRFLKKWKTELHIIQQSHSWAYIQRKP